MQSMLIAVTSKLFAERSRSSSRSFQLDKNLPKTHPLITFSWLESKEGKNTSQFITSSEDVDDTAKQSYIKNDNSSSKDLLKPENNEFSFGRKQLRLMQSYMTRFTVTETKFVRSLV
jgi:hypothetical protein